MRISSHPRFAKAFWVRSVTLCPTAIATVSVETTSGRPNSDRAAYSALKCIWLVFIVSSVNHVLSASRDRPAERVSVDVTDLEVLEEPSCPAVLDRPEVSLVSQRRPRRP